MCGPQIRLCLFTFRPIALKQLNSLTTIVTLIGAEVMHPLWVRQVPGSIPDSGKGLYVWFFVLLLLFFIFCSKTHYLAQNKNNFFCNVDLFISLVYLTYCKICDRL